MGNTPRSTKVHFRFFQFSNSNVYWCCIIHNFCYFFISLYGHQQVQDELLKMTKAQAGIFLVISIVGVFASILYYKALSENSASEIVTITSMWPLFAIVFASLFLGESQDPYLLIVLFLILCYVSAFQFAKNISI